MYPYAQGFLSLGCEWEEIIELGYKATGGISTFGLVKSIFLSHLLRCSTGVLMRRVRCDK